MLLGYLLIQAAGAATTPGFVIEAHCSGGVAGRSERAEITSTGRVSRSRSWTGETTPATTISPALARALSRQLDHAQFDTLPSLPGRTIPDGVTCAITRTGATRHSVRFVTASAPPPAADAARYHEVRDVLGAILAAADTPPSP